MHIAYKRHILLGTRSLNALVQSPSSATLCKIANTVSTVHTNMIKWTH